VIKFNELRTALVNWRAAEREHATLVLYAAHPHHIATAADKEARALRELRLIVDSEPWSDIIQDMTDGLAVALPGKVR